MDKNNYLPWELAVRLALLGFNEPCVAQWNRSTGAKREILKGKNYQTYINFYGYYSDYNLRHYIERRKQFQNRYDAFNSNLDRVCIGMNIAAPLHQQVKEWFRLNYDIDFFERPMVGRKKEYVCDPIGPNITTKLKACETPREALEQAFWYLVDKVKPLPIPELPKEQS